MWTDYREDDARIGRVAAPVFANGWLILATFDIVFYKLNWTLVKFKVAQNLEGFIVLDFHLYL